MSMEISRLYAGALQNYKVPSIPAVSLEEVRKQEELLMQQSSNGYTAHETPMEEKPPKRADAPLENIAVTFNRQEDFGYLGQDSDIHSLDVERAISDMQKDKMLKQYQYFVGSAQDVYHGVQTPDGIVIPKY